MVLNALPLAQDLRRIGALVTRLARQDLEARLDYSSLPLRALEHAVLRGVQAGQCTVSDLSRVLPLAPSSLVSVIDALERKGFLQRQTDPTDRRRTPLVLTPQGEDALLAIPDLDEDSFLVYALSALTQEQQAHLSKVLEMLTSVLTPSDLSDSYPPTRDSR